MIVMGCLLQSELCKYTLKNLFILWSKIIIMLNFDKKDYKHG